MSSAAEKLFARRRRVNFPLWTGTLMVLAVLFVALVGPHVAPKDPRQQNAIIQVDGEWKIPPYPAFTPGFPLGSDDLGRDLYSWLLWAIRPTLILVVSVAAFRMFLGLVIGLGAGWSTGWLGHLCDLVIAGSLAIPSLVAALIVITAVGFKFGVWAFVLGLAATGWAETAQMVREQTREIKSKQSVEAARALGASSGQTLFLHVLPNVMPMIWMLLAFEVSGTLVTLAGLGFLGYYVGGATFVEVGDFVYQRVAGMPELGQMLANAWIVLNEPWAMVAAGTVVFFVVLGFNLLGEGLQRLLVVQRAGSRRFYTAMAGKVLPWFDDEVVEPVGALARHPQLRRAAVTLLLLVALGGGGVWWRQQAPSPTPPPSGEGTAPQGPSAAQTAPGGHLWASKAHDPWGTAWTEALGPASSELAWAFEAEGSFTGGPVVTAEGTIYAVSDAPALYALTPEGKLEWSMQLPVEPAGTPALGPEGHIYVMGKQGDVMNYEPEGTLAWGQLAWHFVPEEGGTVSISPIVGPDGTLYYAMSRMGGNVVRAVSVEGEELWTSEKFSFDPSAHPPILSPSGEWLFWNRHALSTTDGTLLPFFNDGFDTATEYFVGANGELYVRSEREVIELEPADGGVSVGEDYRWFFRDQGIQVPKYAGVTPDGFVWYVGNVNAIQATDVAWAKLQQEGAQGDGLGVIDLDITYTRVVGVDREATIYLCGEAGYDFAGDLEGRHGCMGLGMDEVDLRWKYIFEEGAKARGGALVQDRFYVTTSDGVLHAIGAGRAAPGAPVANRDLPVPGGHAWAAGMGDPWATRSVPYVGAQGGDLLWSFSREGETFAGGPAVAADGTLYLASRAPALYALTPDGTVSWETVLPGKPAGTPALGADGTVYVSHLEGLSAFSPGGEKLWAFTSDAATSAPVVAPDGTLYYKSSGALEAVSSQGEGLWQGDTGGKFSSDLPVLSPDGEVVFWQGFSFATEDGAPDPWGLEERLAQVDGLVVGSDGSTYVVVKESLVPVTPAEGEAELGRTVTWSTFAGHVREVGLLNGKRAWIHGSKRRGMGALFGWATLKGEVPAVHQARGYARRELVVAVDGAEVAYVCEMLENTKNRCYALPWGEEEPEWETDFLEGGPAQGAALAPERLYVVMVEGVLYAFGEAPPAPPPPEVARALFVPGEHAWAAERGDPWATRVTSFAGPRAPRQLWTFEEEGAVFTSPPAVAADGKLYLAVREPPLLYALAPDGSVVGEAGLLGKPAGTPALGPEGTVYVAHLEGLTAFSPDGEELWSFASDSATSAPIVAPDGTIYYKSSGALEAVSPEGERRWQGDTGSAFGSTLPVLGPQGEVVFWRGFSFATSDGAPDPWALQERLTRVDGLIVDLDGSTYVVVQENLVPVRPGEGEAELGEPVPWASLGETASEGVGGAVGKEGGIWSLIRRVGHIGWQGNLLDTYRDLMSVVDEENVAYSCGQSPDGAIGCGASEWGADGALWVVADLTGDDPQGVALAPARLYLVTLDGKLHAIGD